MLPRQELRAHAHAERHRIHSELQLLSHAVGAVVEVDEADEPGVAWKPMHHHDAGRARDRVRSRAKSRHWKRKEWKRRTAQRRARALAFRLAGQ
jgi:hypothetical protein